MRNSNSPARASARALDRGCSAADVHRGWADIGWRIIPLIGEVADEGALILLFELFKPLGQGPATQGFHIEVAIDAAPQAEGDVDVEMFDWHR